MTFTNRTDAGDQLAAALVEHTYPDPVVLALPRGGVPVSAPIAAALRAPLGPGDGAQDRRLQTRGGYCGGVVNGDDPHIVVNPVVLAATGLTQDQVRELAMRELLTI